MPGVIGKVGTLFGDAGVNIANMAVSRTRRGGKALMVLSVDSEPEPDLVEQVRAEGFDDAPDQSLKLVSTGSTAFILERVLVRFERGAALARAGRARCRVSPPGRGRGQDRGSAGTPTAEDTARAVGCKLGRS